MSRVIDPNLKFFLLRGRKRVCCLKFSNMRCRCLFLSLFCSVRRRTAKPFRSSRSRFYLTGATRSTPACTASGYTGRPATSERAHTVELLESRAGWRQRRGHRSSGSDSPPALATRHRHFHLEVISVSCGKTTVCHFCQ